MCGQEAPNHAAVIPCTRSVFAKVRHGGRRIESPGNDANKSCFCGPVYFRYVNRSLSMAGIIGSKV